MLPYSNVLLKFFWKNHFSFFCLLQKRTLNSACGEARAVETYLEVLEKKGSGPHIHRALAKVKTQLKLSESSVEEVLRKCAVNGNEMAGLRFLIWAGQLQDYRHKHSTYKTAYTILGVMEKPKMLSQVLADMRKEGYGVSIKTFRVLFNLCKAGKLVEEALELLDLIKEFNCRPDMIIYNTVIHLLCEAGRMELGKMMLHQALELDLSPNVITYSALVKGFTSLGQLDDAQRLVHQMKEQGCVPNVVTYTILLAGSSKAISPEKGLEVLYTMFRKQCTPNVVTYTALVQSFCEEGRLTEALEVFDGMIIQGCAPNSVTYNILINALCRDGSIDAAYKLTRKMIEEGYLPKDQCHNSFMISLLRTNKMEEAQNLLKNMLESGIELSGLEYNTLIKGLCLVGRYYDALSWYLKMECEDYSLESEACSILLFGLCHRGYVDEAARVLEGMVGKGILLEVSTFDVVIGYLNKAGRGDKALNLISNLNCQGYSS